MAQDRVDLSWAISVCSFLNGHKLEVLIVVVNLHSNIRHWTDERKG